MLSGIQNGTSPSRTRGLTLPRFHVHQIVGNFLMNGGRDEQEGTGTAPASERTSKPERALWTGLHTHRMSSGSGALRLGSTNRPTASEPATPSTAADPSMNVRRRILGYSSTSASV